MSESYIWVKKVKRVHEQEELERRQEIEQYKREVARKKAEDSYRVDPDEWYDKSL